MLTVDALAYCDNSPVKLGKLIGKTSQAISQWGDVVPELSAARLEKKTKGKLKYDCEFYIQLEAQKLEAQRKKAA